MFKLRSWVGRKVAGLHLASEEGQGLAEYGLILAFIAIVCIAALTALGGGISAALGNLTGSL